MENLLKIFEKTLKNRSFKPLIKKTTLIKRIKELAKIISSDYKNKSLFLICILKGSVFFTCELSKNLTIDTILDFICISSYENKRKSNGIVKITKDLDNSIENKDVLICEDIIDSGYTLSYLIKMLKTRKPKSIKICTMLNKQSRRKINIKIDYVGFEIEDKFVLGFGLDYDQHIRNLPYIAYSENNL